MQIYEYVYLYMYIYIHIYLHNCITYTYISYVYMSIVYKQGVGDERQAAGGGKAHQGHPRLRLVGNQQGIVK